MKCTGRVRIRDGATRPCKRPAIPGGTVCPAHGGSAPQVRAKAAVRDEVLRWGLGTPDVDPGEILLRLVSQSAARAEHYARLLEQAYDAAERLATAKGDLLDGPLKGDGEMRSAVADQAREDLDRIFTTGGVAALVGNTYGATATGTLYATGEAIRGLALLEAQERDRCAGFAAKAVAAGLAERQVRLAEKQGALIADVLRAVLADPALGLTREQRRAIPDVGRRVLALVR